MFIFLSTCCTIILFYSAYSKFKNCNFIKQSRCVNTKITGDRNVKSLYLEIRRRNIKIRKVSSIVIVKLSVGYRTLIKYLSKIMNVQLHRWKGTKNWRVLKLILFSNQRKERKKKREMKTHQRNHARYSRNICDSKTSLGFYGSSCTVLFLN